MHYAITTRCQRRLLLRRSSTLIALLALACGARANDLLRYYQLALDNDSALRVSEAQRDAAAEARAQARAQLLPTLFADASVTRQNDGLEIGAQQIGNQPPACSAPTTGNMQQCVGTVHSYGLRLSQPLWSYESFHRLKEANLLAASSTATLLNSHQNLILRVSQAYFAILGATDQLTTDRNTQEAFRVLLEQAKGRELAGISPHSDVDNAQSYYDATGQGVIDAENTLDDARLALTQIVGVRVQDIAPVREDIPLDFPEPESVEDWVEAACQDNPGVRAAELNVAAANQEISVQRGKGLPTMSLVGSNSRIWQEPALGGNQAFDTIGMTFNWPLFQGGAVSSGVRQSRALYRQAEATYAGALRDTERQTRAAYRGVVSGIRRIAAARRAVDTAHAAVESSRHNVEFGTGGEFELLVAQSNYATELRQYSQTRYDYLLSVLTLKQLAGRLGKEDLADVDKLLLRRDP
jgi:outer membrane protein